MIAAAGGAVVVGGLFAVVFLLAVYLLPTIIGKVRGVPNVGSIAVVNIFLGWTFIGWVIALAMAARSSPSDRNVSNVAVPVAVSMVPAEARKAGSSAAVSEIEQLAALHAKGTLSDEEFAAAKARLIRPHPDFPLQSPRQSPPA